MKNKIELGTFDKVDLDYSFYFSVSFSPLLVLLSLPPLLKVGINYK